MRKRLRKKLERKPCWFRPGKKCDFVYIDEPPGYAEELAKILTREPLTPYQHSKVYELQYRIHSR